MSVVMAPPQHFPDIIIFISFAVQDNIAERECCGVPCKCIGTRGDRGSIGLGGSKVSRPSILLFICENV